MSTPRNEELARLLQASFDAGALSMRARAVDLVDHGNEAYVHLIAVDECEGRPSVPDKSNRTQVAYIGEKSGGSAQPITDPVKVWNPELEHLRNYQERTEGGLRRVQERMQGDRNVRALEALHEYGLTRSVPDTLPPSVRVDGLPFRVELHGGAGAISVQMVFQQWPPDSLQLTWEQPGGAESSHTFARIDQRAT